MKLLPVACLWAAMVVGPDRVVASRQTPPTPAGKPATITASKGARTVELTAGDNLKFDKTEITARRGEMLRVILKSVGTIPKMAMGHNFVLLKLGTDQVAFNNAAFNARETDYIPPDMKDAVLAATKLAGPGESVDVTFKVPAKPGRYPYLCSFPGHFTLGMRGTLSVK